MIPTLFGADDSVWIGRGMGALSEATNCLVTKGGELTYELEMDYPANGRHYSELVERRIILAKPDQVDEPQPFRIYRITKPVKGMVTVYAQHISYDLDGVVAWPFTASSATDMASKLKWSEAPASRFSYSCDFSFSQEFENKKPTALRSLLGGGDQTWAGVFGGDLVVDGYSISLKQNGGTDRNVTIRYGVDLIDARMEQNIADTYTGIVPYYDGGNDEEPVIGHDIYVENPPPYKKVKAVDVSEYISSTPTREDVDAVGRRWLQDNNIRKPVVSLTLEYAQLHDKVVQIYDPIHVLIEKLGLDLTAKVSKTVWDVLRERYKSVEVGDVRPTLGGAIYDASRLKKGLLPAERIAPRSVGGGALKRGTVTESEMGKNSVNVNQIVDGAVRSEKIYEGAVTGIKVLDEAISFAKLDHDLQVFYTDILAANAIYSGFLNADGSVNAAVVTISNYLSIGGTIYEPKTYTVKDTRNTYSVSNTYGSAERDVNNLASVKIGTTTDTWYTAALSKSSETQTTYNLYVLGPRASS